MKLGHGIHALNKASFITGRRNFESSWLEQEPTVHYF